MCGGSPDEGCAIGIVIGDEMIDPLNQLAHRAERTAADGEPMRGCECSVVLINVAGRSSSTVRG